MSTHPSDGRPTRTRGPRLPAMRQTLLGLAVGLIVGGTTAGALAPAQAFWGPPVHIKTRLYDKTGTYDLGTVHCTLPRGQGEPSGCDWMQANWPAP